MDGSMVVAVVSVWMMKVPVYEVVDVISMGYGGMAAAGPVSVTGFVAFAGVRRCAFRWMFIGYRESVFVDVVSVWVVEVTIVEVVDVTLMLDTNVPASGTVDMGMVGVDVARDRAHGIPLILMRGRTVGSTR